MRTEEELAQLDDPAEDGTGGYADRMAQAAEAQLDAAEPEAGGEWSELSEAERSARVRDAPVEETAVEQTPDAPADPDAVDWHAFAREFNFHLAGQGCQNRHTTEHKLVEAIRVSDHVATTSPEDFLREAVAADAVPLVADVEHGYLFGEEVLADE